MRQRLLTMTRRLQERPCWSLDENLVNENIDDTIEQLVNLQIIVDFICFFICIEIRFINR